MCRRLLFVLVIPLCAALSGCKESEGPGAAGNPFVGQWAPHYERTLEEGKKSPKYRPETAEKVSAMIKKIMESMKLEVTAEEMVYLVGGTRLALPYTVASTNPAEKTMTITLETQDSEAQVTFHLIDDKYMNFKSTGSDDLDYYIWERAPAGSGKDSL